MDITPKDKEPPDRGPKYPSFDRDRLIPPRGRSQTRNVSRKQFLKRKQDDTSRSPTATGRSASLNISRKMEPNKKNITNKPNSKKAQTPVSRTNVGVASSSKLSIDKMTKSKNKETGKIAIETAAPEATSIDKEAKKVLKTPTSSPPDKKPKHQEKVSEKTAKVEELPTAHPHVYVFAPDSDLAQVLMDEIETPTLPPPTSGMDTNTATLPPSTEIGGTINDNIEQNVRETNVLRTDMSKKTPPLDIEQQPATLPPPAVEIDSTDASTPLPPETIQGDTQETEVVDTATHDSTVWSEQSDEHNKELMDEDDKIKKDLNGLLNIDVSKLLNEFDYSSSDTSDSDMKFHSTDKTSEMPKSQSTALDDRRPLVSKVIQHSDEEYNEEEDDEGRRPRAQLIHTETDDQDKAWKSLDEDKLPSYIQGAQNMMSSGPPPISKAQEHATLSPVADNTTSGQAVESMSEGALDASQDTKGPLPEELRADESTQDQVPDTFHQTPDSLPAGKEPKKYKEGGHIEPQRILSGNSKESPQSQLSPTSSTRQEGNNGENELSSINKEESLKKTPSQDFSGIRDTFHGTSDPPKNIPNQKVNFSLDVEKSNFPHTFINTCANLPQDSLPSTYKGGTVSDPLPNAYFEDSSEMGKNRSPYRVSEKSNAEIGETGKTEFFGNQKVEIPKNIIHTFTDSYAEMGQKYGAIGDQRRPFGRGEQVFDPAKITSLFEQQTFSYTEQNTVEENNLFITPNKYSGTEDGKYNDPMNFSIPLRSVYAVPEPGPEKCLNYTSETIKGVDKQTNEDKTNPQRTMYVDPKRIKYTSTIVKEAEAHQQQKNDEELHAQHIAEFNSEYLNSNTDGNLAESEKQTERDDSSTCSSEEQMETDQIISEILTHTGKDNNSEDINVTKGSEVKADTKKTETDESAEMLKKDREDNLKKEKERKTKREEIKKRREAQRIKDEDAKNTEKIEGGKTGRKDSLDKIEVIQSDNRNGTTTLSTPSEPKLNKDISDGIEITPSTSFIQHPTHNQMTDRLDILYRQVDEESEKMTEDLLNNMIDHNPKMEGSKHMLRERLREAVYNTSREICIKSKEQEIIDLTCANCTGAHPASYKQCPVYLNRLDVIEKRKILAEKGKKKYVNAPDPGNIWAKRMQDRENQNSDREARQPGSGAQETQLIHNPPPSNIPHAQVGTAVSGGFVNEKSGQRIKALSDKFKTLGNLIDIPNMVNEIGNLIQEVQRTTDKYSHRRLLMNFFYGDCLEF
ncbi:hypothetical protein JTB14_025721 [Gonioctena quinquepunctata]|nr:hypothetical protein JTB14_025721 [Gonioctena quinquepunctata]